MRLAPRWRCANLFTKRTQLSLFKVNVASICVDIFSSDFLDLHAASGYKEMGELERLADTAVITQKYLQTLPLRGFPSFYLRRFALPPSAFSIRLRPCSLSVLHL